MYVLPVEAGTESRYGNGLLAVKKLDLHNKHGLIFVQPTFARLPWYADHATEPTIRQETHFLKVAVPFVEKQYPVRAAAGARLLLGFSKSGWGAFSLLLRNPEMFGKAAAWNAPLAMDRPNYGMDGIVGSLENFEKYRIGKLLESRADALKKEKRLALVGYNAFQQHHQTIHDRMEQLKIPHEYRDDKKAKHTWDAGWLEDAVRSCLIPEDRISDSTWAWRRAPVLFLVCLVLLQVGIYRGALESMTLMINRSTADLWIVTPGDQVGQWFGWR